jgi:hypothetical protein
LKRISGFAGTATAVSMRAFAWLLIQKFAAKMEIAPNTAAIPIIGTILFFTPAPPALLSFLLCGKLGGKS